MTFQPTNESELQLYRVLQRSNLLSYYDTFISQGKLVAAPAWDRVIKWAIFLLPGGDDVQQLCDAGEEEFLEIMALVGMANKPLHVRRLQKALQEWVSNPGKCDCYECTNSETSEQLLDCFEWIQLKLNGADEGCLELDKFFGADRYSVDEERERKTKWVVESKAPWDCIFLRIVWEELFCYRRPSFQGRLDAVIRSLWCKKCEIQSSKLTSSSWASPTSLELGFVLGNLAALDNGSIGVGSWLTLVDCLHRQRQ